jgi:transposase
MPEHHDFLNLYKTESDPRTRIRLLALHHVYDEGKKYVEVSDLLKFERHTISSWVRRYEKEGVGGLRDRPGRGARQRLAPESVPEFKNRVMQERKQRGGGRLKGEGIRMILKESLNADYSLSGIYELLRRCGMSCG